MSTISRFFILLCLSCCFMIVSDARSHKKRALKKETENNNPVPFMPNCELPFKAIAKKHQVDNSCGVEGISKNESNRLQNSAKNNFCANNAPIPMTINDFITLQEKADSKGISHGHNHLPSSRKELNQIMELHGSLGETSHLSLPYPFEIPKKIWAQGPGLLMMVADSDGPLSCPAWPRSPTISVISTECLMRGKSKIRMC